MAKKYHDFDQAFKEHKQETIGIKYKGKKYEVPGTPTIGAQFILQKVGTLKGKAQSEFIEKELESFGRLVLGREVFDALTNEDCSPQQFVHIFTWVCEQYTELAEKTEKDVEKTGKKA